MASKLDQVRAMTMPVADTGDFKPSAQFDASIDPVARPLPKSVV